MIEFTTPSGAKVKIVSSDFKEVISLKNAVTRELKNSGVNFANIDIQKFDILDSKILNTILEAVLSLDSSDEVYKNVFVCLKRCLYNGQKITEDLFEDEAVREDYYQIVFETLKENLRPFFKGVVSQLSQSDALSQS